VLGTAEVLYGGWEKAFTLIASYEAATRDGVREAARKIFQENNKTVGKLIPEGGAK
jgi:predicted Zn-dependent peptidase